MKIVDANVLIASINRKDPRHEEAHHWVGRFLSGDETIGLAWTVMLAFLRITTHPRVFPRPLTSDQALTHMAAWVEAPPVVVLSPGARHLRRMRGILSVAGMGGNQVMDAHLAALALDFHAVIVSYDQDFGRFPGILWETPEIQN